MKKSIKLVSVILTVVILAAVFCIPVSADNITIIVNGAEIFPDTPPVIVSDRTLVPVRFIAEAFHYDVKWIPEYKAVKISDGNTSLDMFIGSTLILKTVKGEIPEEILSDVEAEIINDRTFLPLRAVGEAFGANVEWDENTRSVIVTK